MATLFFPFGASFDGNGVPRNGATLSFFQTGTSTPQNTYTDSTLVSPNQNPLPADSNGLFPPIYLSASFDYKAILKDAAGNTIATRDPIGYTPAVSQTPPPSYLNGLNIQNAGGVSTFTVATGSAADTTNTSLMKLAASLPKTTTAWAAGAGAGALDTGVIANSTSYHVHLIQRVDTGAVDILISLSATTPTLPANYTLFRRIRSMKTDSSAHWVAEVQDGDLIQFVTLVTDVNVNGPGTTALTKAISVPTGINVQALLQIGISNADGTACYSYTSDLATTDSTPAAGLSDTSIAITATIAAYTTKTVRTNTSAQIRTRASYSSGNVTLTINTLGYIDTRGKNV